MGRSMLLALLVAVAGWSAAAQAAPGRAKFGMIVVFKEGVEPDDGPAQPDPRRGAEPEKWGYVDERVLAAVQRREARLGFAATHAYSAALRGFAAQLDAEQIAALEQDPAVAYVENDGLATAFRRRAQPSAQVLPWGINKVDADLSSTVAGDGSGAVSGVRVYVIDTGIDASHPDLNVVKQVNATSASSADDCNGHGTHVAGIIGAKDNASDVVGVAPGVPLVSVRVLNCLASGSISDVIKGIDWVTANAVKPAVVNLSLGALPNDALDDAVRRSADAGLFYAVAAGNDGQDACDTSPARVGPYPGVLTVAATTNDDSEASFSNYGACVGLWAPGDTILSTRLGGGTTSMSGTSMAAPHVAGAAALRLSTNPGATPASVESTLGADAVATGKSSKDGAAIRRLDVHRY